jgi:hypothetical protein
VSTAPRSRTKQPDPVVEEPPVGEVPSARPEKKIAIVGFTGSRNEAPWGEDGWDIWPCNNLWKFIPDTWTALFDLHDDDTIKSDEDHEKFLRGETVKKADGTETSLNGRPVFVWKPRPEWPTSVAFPREAMLDGLAQMGVPAYFTNSISWLVAFALMQNPTDLHIYGVDMAQGGDSDSEYASQRPSCEFFLGLAAGAGVKIHVPQTSDLLKCTVMYGWGDDSALRVKLDERMKELKGRLEQIQQNQAHLAQQERQLRDAQMQMMGALETTSYFRTVWTNPRGTRNDNANSEAPDAQAIGG